MSVSEWVKERPLLVFSFIIVITALSIAMIGGLIVAEYSEKRERAREREREREKREEREKRKRGRGYSAFHTPISCAGLGSFRTRTTFAAACLSPTDFCYIITHTHIYLLCSIYIFYVIFIS
jgi:hypothetical protein